MTEPRAHAIGPPALDFLSSAGFGAPGGGVEAAPLEGGSDRLFARIRAGGRSAVLLSQTPGPEIDSYIDIGRFLRRSGVAVPEIFAFDRKRGFVLMEDLGDLHLEDELAAAGRGTELRRYREAIGVLVEFHAGVAGAMSRERLLADRVFDEGTLLGETEYFAREFMEDFCRVRPPAGWERERRLLASSLAAEPRVFMHRDFQSRNLMIADDRIRIVDFQTAHRGPGLYDAASLLKDAYHPLPPPARRALVDELHGRLRERGERAGESLDEFHAKFVLAGIQRNMQALAAFAKLGVKKGKRKFLDSIPRGLDLLEEGIVERGDLPALAAMAAAIRGRIEGEPKKGS